MAGYSRTGLDELRAYVFGSDIESVERLVLERPAPKFVDGRPIIQLHSPQSGIYFNGQVLADLDREIRRTVAWLDSGVATLPRRPSDLELEASGRSESHEFILLVAGHTANLLLSHPVQLLITLSWFWDRRPSRWGVRAPKNPRPAIETVPAVAANAAQAIAHGGSPAYQIRVEPDGALEVNFLANIPIRAALPVDTQAKKAIAKKSTGIAKKTAAKKSAGTPRKGAAAKKTAGTPRKGAAAKKTAATPKKATTPRKAPRKRT